MFSGSVSEALVRQRSFFTYEFTDYTHHNGHANGFKFNEHFSR